MRRAIHFCDPALQGNPIRHIATEQNRKIDRAAALRNQRGQGARQSGGTGSLYAGRAQRHPQKRERPVRIAQNPTPQLT